jgi:hypothetical protein
MTVPHSQDLQLRLGKQPIGDVGNSATRLATLRLTKRHRANRGPGVRRRAMQHAE